MNMDALTAMRQAGMTAVEVEFRDEVLPVQGIIALGGTDVGGWCWVLGWVPVQGDTLA